MTGFFGRLIHHPWALGLGTTGVAAGLIMLQHHVRVIMDSESTEAERNEAGYALAGDCALVVSGLLAYGHAINNAYNEWREQNADGGGHAGGGLGHDGGHDDSDHDDSDHDAIEMEEGHAQGGDDPDVPRLDAAVTSSVGGLTALATQLGQERDALPQLQILIPPVSAEPEHLPTVSLSPPLGQASPPPGVPAIEVSDSEEEHLIDRRAERRAQQQAAPVPAAAHSPTVSLTMSAPPADDTKDTPSLAPPVADEHPGGTPVHQSPQTEDTG